MVTDQGSDTCHNQETGQAEILIGRRNTYSNGSPIGGLGPVRETPAGWLQEFGWEELFALYVGAAYITGSKSRSTEGYRYTCKLAAEQFGEKMKQRGISNYIITNGERNRATTRERVLCHQMPEDGVLIFRETLDAKLKSTP